MIVLKGNTRPFWNINQFRYQEINLEHKNKKERDSIQGSFWKRKLNL